MKYISQNCREISQTRIISAKTAGKSAKLEIYQPKLQGNQPNLKYISQNYREISQTWIISAKTTEKSAKLG
ncbi:hypothetical protein [Niallia circulans]|uniref:hypothetical protein n=1 Tax=Niallia circulans TaxID=1397 RepID=UPI00201E6553|nr:hypothetical protein [Niallia circulans]